MKRTVWVVVPSGVVASVRWSSPVLRRPVDLSALVGELEHAYPSLLVDVVEPVVVDGDQALLRHALANLVDNAVRHDRVGDAVPGVEVVVRGSGRRAAARWSSSASPGPGRRTPGRPLRRPHHQLHHRLVQTLVWTVRR